MNFNQLLTKLNPFKKNEEGPLPINTVGEKEEGAEVQTPPKRVFGGKQDVWKLSEQDKQMVVSLWASGLTPSEVIDRAREEFNISLSTAQVVKYSKAEKWQPLIKKIRQETFSDLAAVAGSHKRVRLERGEKIYEKSVSRGKLDLALKAVEHQRKEMEGGGDFNLTLNQYNLLSDEELEEKRKQVIEKIARSNKGVITIEQPTDKGTSTES